MICWLMHLVPTATGMRIPYPLMHWLYLVLLKQKKPSTLQGADDCEGGQFAKLLRLGVME